MNKNHLTQVWYLSILVLAFFLVFSWLPDFSILTFPVKKPFLADLLVDDQRPLKHDSLPIVKDAVVRQKVVRKHGPAPIEEFGTENLSYFFDALRFSKTEPVRVAFFGDSFIEGDIFCGPFRDTLQRLFGGSGVGYMPITSEVTKFRTSIQHEFAHWETFSMVGQKREDAPLGLPGYCFVPVAGNEVTFKPAARNFVTAKFFYERGDPSLVKYVLNDSTFISAELPSSETLGQFDLPGRDLNSVTLSFPSPDHLRCYGAAFEDSIGISVDNFSMRSNPGMGLLLIDRERVRQFNSLRDYKLVVLQYGLNVLSEKDLTGYTWYLYKMVALVQRLKEDFPGCAFLLLSVGDRCSNQNGKMATLPDVKVMRDVQRTIAQKSGIAFWDMFEAMGGENSIVHYTESNPPLAAKDYTHLTFRGGRKIAKKLADALLKEKSKYDKR
ncbi:MAG TPA: hypothetical protein VKQ08_07500 [Cyclobacteriaceae bacterium]|nr:hypothetical protein [Cyclobacteriaceae bacterium]